MPSLSVLASDNSRVLSLPLPFPPVVESLATLLLDADTSSFIVIPFVLPWGGLLPPATLDLAISTKTNLEEVKTTKSNS